ncbi:unnamed protein product, partial [Hymenolepis diminuta]
FLPTFRKKISFYCGVRVQRPPQPISNRYPCSLALFVSRAQAHGERLIRSSVRLKFLLSHRLSVNRPSPRNSSLILTTLGAA